jgi:hypothetical protein
LAAGNRAWQEADVAIVAAGMAAVVDDGYWRVAPQPGAGAARLARFAACALVAPELVDPDVAFLLLEPWRSVVGGP